MLKNHKFITAIFLSKVLVILFLSMLIAAGCNKDQIRPDDKNLPEPVHKNWTFMFYDDADFEYAYDPLANFRQQMFSGENLNVLALQDSEKEPAYLWYIDENRVRVKLKEMGEVNMGDYKTLFDFVNYSKTTYSADRYIISFYDHGGGWAGACHDKTDKGWLTMDEIQRALKDAGGVDMVLFSAPCLMGAVESVYELRDVTDVYIGSEHGSGYLWWMNPMGDIRLTLEETPGISTYKLGEKVIEYILDWSKSASVTDQLSLTMSAMRTDKITALKDALDAASSEYLGDMGHFNSLINDINYKKIQNYDQYSVDTYDLAEKLLNVEENPQIRSKLEQVMECLQDTVIAECHGKALAGSHGLSIYFPDKSGTYKYNEYYGSAEYKLDFPADTCWDELLAAYFGPDNRVLKDPAANLPQSPFSKTRQESIL